MFLSIFDDEGENDEDNEVDEDDEDDDAGPKWSGIEAGFNMWSMSHAAQTRH